MICTPADELRFWEKVGPEDDNGCWPWVASRKAEGYGKVSWQGRMRPAHQVSLELAGVNAPGPDWEVDHVVCQNPPCVRPDHLEWVPVPGRENSVRYYALQTHCRRGHEWTPENTVLKPRGNGRMKRHCRTCLNGWFRQYRALRAAR